MLMEHNRDAYEKFKNMLLKYHECCLVAATGIGRSNIAIEFINEFNLNTLIICPKISIKSNWIDMSTKYNCPSISATTYQSFTKHLDKFDGFDCYIFDEAHHAGSEVWGQAISKFKEDKANSVFIIGLTADSKRYFDKQDVAVSIFNSHVVYGLSEKKL